MELADCNELKNDVKNILHLNFNCGCGCNTSYHVPFDSLFRCHRPNPPLQEHLYLLIEAQESYDIFREATEDALNKIFKEAERRKIHHILTSHYRSSNHLPQIE